MRGYSVVIAATPTMVVGGQATEPGRALAGTVSYPAAAVVSNPSGGQTVYLGGITVDTTGWPLAAGSSIEVDLVGDILYGVTSTTTQTLHILRRGE